jgi:cytosine/adenosine deaminase-related metal-dependent hydrolase
MSKTLLIKGGIVLTLDKSSRSGIFDLTVKNGKISSIDYEGKTDAKEFLAANPAGEVIDANGKIVMPGLFNSRLVSAYSLCRMFFTKCSYENIGSFVSMNLIDRYLAESVNRGRLTDMLELIYRRSLKNGELFVNESSPSFKKLQADDVYSNLSWINQYFNFTSYDLKIIEDPRNLRDQIIAGLKADEDINAYTISSLKRLLATRKSDLIIDASISRSASESIKQTFGKPFVNVLSENGLLNNSTLLVNPCNITDGEIGIIKEKDSLILICPSDYAELSNDLQLVRKIISSGIRLIVGTGMTGTDMLSELKTLSILASGNISYESVVRMAVTEPAGVFGIGNITGSIEKTKSADLIFLSLRDIRNSGGLPDLESESVCWHLINSLTTKDVTDVIFKGDHVFNSSKEDKEKKLKDAARTAEITTLLYSAGKFREYKERKKMEVRVDRLGISSDKEEKPEVFVDMVETGEYTGEGEFKILGNKIEEYQQSRESVQDELHPDLLEITSIDSDLNFIEDDKEVFETPKLGIKLVEAKRHVKLEVPAKAVKELVKVDEELEDRSSKRLPEQDAEVTSPKKSKLKFGFKDGE